MFSFRKSAALALTSVVAASTILSASAASTDKNLSSNFTLVNLVEGENNGQIAYVKPDGTQWRPTESFTLDDLGAQLIRRQYEDNQLAAGSGSVVVSTDGPVGAVVQIQARAPQVPTFGAYVGVSEGAAEANLPLVLRRRGTASGTGNSQIIIQNASSSQIDVEVQLIDGTNGSTTFTKTFNDLNPNAAVEYDLDDEAASNVPDGWFGSAKIRSTTAGGQVAVVSNLFSGDHAMQTFNAFTTSKTRWGVPLFASKLANSLSTPVSVQNTGTTEIPADTVTLSCIKDPASPGDQNISFTNSDPIAPSASYFFNPVTDDSMPSEWFGACTVDSDTFQTAVFVQLRTVEGNRAGAHEGIPLDSTDTTAVIPLYAKRLTNGFASAVTIQNLGNAQANVTLTYRAGEGKGNECNATVQKTIPAGGSLIQNHRINGNPNSVPELADNCFGTLTIEANQPVHAFAQLDLLDDILDPDPGGDPFQAHNAFTIAN
jgi:hypothetical protein